MYRSIMVAFSDWQAERSAMTVAISLARKSAARLHIVHVRGSRPAAVFAPDDLALDSAVDWAVSELDESVSFRMLPGSAIGLSAIEIAERLSAYAGEHDIELVVMSRRRHSIDQLLFGSVGAEMLKITAATFLFVPSGAPTLWRTGCRILVPVDATLLADEMAHEAAAIARLLSGSVILVGTVQPFEPGAPHAFLDLHAAQQAAHHEREVEACLAGVARELRAEGTDVECIVRFGTPVDVVREAAKSLDIDLVAVPALRALSGEPDHRVAAALFRPFDTAILHPGLPSDTAASRRSDLVT